MFRRRSAPIASEALQRFDALATALDRAQRALLQAVPTARHPGASLTDALDAFQAGLAEVAALMPGWRTPGTEALWATCDASLAQSLAEVRALRAAPPGPTEFEALNGRIGDVLAPLEDFLEVERTLKRRR